jgi:hypothetical protein
MGTKVSCPKCGNLFDSGISATGRLAKPSVDEVTEYMRQQGFQNPDLTAARFMDYYEVRGWIPNGARVQMKSWKAAVRTWKSRQNGNKPGMTKKEEDEYILSQEPAF